MNGIGKLTKPKRRRRYPIPDWCGETSWDYPFNNCPSRQRSTGTISAIIRRPPGFSRPDICFGLALVMASPLSVDRNQLMRGKKKCLPQSESTLFSRVFYTTVVCLCTNKAVHYPLYDYYSAGSSMCTCTSSRRRCCQRESDGSTPWAMIFLSGNKYYIIRSLYCTCTVTVGR